MDQELVEPSFGLSGAIRYLFKNWDKLTRFLQVSDAPQDNVYLYNCPDRIVFRRNIFDLHIRQHVVKVVAAHQEDVASLNLFRVLKNILNSLPQPFGQNVTN